VRDVVDLDAMRKVGLPFWLAGTYGSPEQFRQALAEGAAGVQVGTAFALCEESGLIPELRKAFVRLALAGKARVMTSPTASPTGFPFKIAELDGSLSDEALYRHRRRCCDLGFLRDVYLKPDASLGYRCSAEPEAAYVAKGGKLEDTLGRRCLCNALLANIGLPQRLGDGREERPMVTLGDDYANIGRFCTPERPDYTAADVVRTILG
jgi:nitronate monooxygenase